jgi:RNA polymerase-binding transcription factor DksA
VESATDHAARLRDERDRRERQLAELTRAHDRLVAASEASNADDEHDPEGATIAFERSQLAAQIALVRAGAAQVDAALERAASSGFGTCASCGDAIDPARLEARPAATTCIACASA